MEVNVRATKDQIIEFKQSILWKDIKRELGSWKLGFKKELIQVIDNVASENPNTPALLTHLGDINGRIKTVDYVLSLPDVFLQIIEDNKTV